MDNYNSYMGKSVEQLFQQYAFENDRISKEDAAITKQHIVIEMYRRLKVAFELLEEDTEESAKQTYKQFIHL